MTRDEFRSVLRRLLVRVVEEELATVLVDPALRQVVEEERSAAVAFFQRDDECQTPPVRSPGE